MFKLNYLNTKILHKKINYNTLFSKFAKYFKSDTNRVIYTEPLNIQDILNVTPARLVPKDIIRPDYAIKKSILTPKRERSIIKNPADVENFTYACKVAAGAVKLGMESAKEGMSTDDIDKIIHEYIISKNCYPSAIGFMGFPKSLCTSVNEVVCHGIPNKRKLKSGDILNMDVTTYYKGYHGDTSGMALIGEVHPDIQKLIRVTRESMFKAISICKPGVKVKKIGEVIEDYVKQYNYTVCVEFAGHGVGKQLHMLPSVMHSREENDTEDVMEEGMAFTIEPIIMMHPYTELQIWEDKWTIVCPNNPSAQWEHSMIITKDGCEILTKREGEELLLL